MTITIHRRIFSVQDLLLNDESHGLQLQPGDLVIPQPLLFTDPAAIFNKSAISGMV
jgi:hypothetical protein